MIPSRKGYKINLWKNLHVWAKESSRIRMIWKVFKLMKFGKSLKVFNQINDDSNKYYKHTPNQNITQSSFDFFFFYISTPPLFTPPALLFFTSFWFKLFGGELGPTFFWTVGVLLLLVGEEIMLAWGYLWWDSDEATFCFSFSLFFDSASIAFPTPSFLLSTGSFFFLFTIS